MWGYHYGPTLTDRRYGLEHSNVILPGESEFENSHLSLLENSRNVWIFIPAGLAHDLIDFNSLSGFTEIPLVTNDVIGGFSHSSIFNILDETVLSPSSLKVPLSTVAPSGTTSAQINMLFSNYGY